MSNIIDAKYVSIWDDGATEVWSDVEVDFDEMAITGWDEDSKTYVGYAPADDGELDVLDEEKVIIEDGTEYTAMSSDEYENFGRDDEESYDAYGNGIIVYNV